MMRRVTIAIVAVAAVVAGGSARAEDAAPPATEVVGRTPPRLSFVDGEVSFWRPGANDWTSARVNTAMAPGDAIYAGTAANLELQIGARAFVRAGEATQLGLENQELDFLQFKVTAGHVSLDLRGLPSGYTVELDTPQAAFTLERAPPCRRSGVCLFDADRAVGAARRTGNAVAGDAA